MSNNDREVFICGSSNCPRKGTPASETAANIVQVLPLAPQPETVTTTTNAAPSGEFTNRKPVANGEGPGAAALPKDYEAAGAFLRRKAEQFARENMPNDKLQSTPRTDACLAQYAHWMMKEERSDRAHGWNSLGEHARQLERELAAMRSAAASITDDWRAAALRLGEQLADTGPDNYYGMTPTQWLERCENRVPSATTDTLARYRDALETIRDESLSGYAYDVAVAALEDKPRPLDKRESTPLGATLDANWPKEELDGAPRTREVLSGRKTIGQVRADLERLCVTLEHELHALKSATTESLPRDAALVAATVERVANEQPVYRETTIHNLKRAAEILREYVVGKP